MNSKFLVVFDLETSSAKPLTTQILQLSAIAVDPRSLKIADTFSSYFKPLDFTTLEKEALDVNKITIEQLQQAPDTAVVWQQFCEWVFKFHRGYKVTPDGFSGPIPCGYNITNFDMIIINEYCRKFGPWDDKRQSQKLFNTFYAFDLFHHMWFWTENNPEVNRLKLTSVMDWMGFSKERVEGAHNAINDTKNTYDIIVRLIKLQRYLTQPREESGVPLLQMKNCFANVTA